MDSSRLLQTIARLESTMEDCSEWAESGNRKQLVRAENGRTARRDYSFLAAMRAMLALLDVLEHGGSEGRAIAQAEAVIARARWHWQGGLKSPQRAGRRTAAQRRGNFRKIKTGTRRPRRGGANLHGK